MRSEFYKYICSKENCVYLNGKNLLYPKASDIIYKFIEVDEKNCGQLRNNLCHFKNIFQYVYSSLYPEFTAQLIEEVLI